MKIIDELGWYIIDNNTVLMIGKKYNGNPIIMCEYDLLICSKEVYEHYKEELVPKHLINRGWNPDVKYVR